MRVDSACERFVGWTDSCTSHRIDLWWVFPSRKSPHSHIHRRWFESSPTRWSTTICCGRAVDCPRCCAKCPSRDASPSIETRWESKIHKMENAIRRLTALVYSLVVAFRVFCGNCWARWASCFPLSCCWWSMSLCWCSCRWDWTAETGCILVHWGSMTSDRSAGWWWLWWSSAHFVRIAYSWRDEKKEKMKF